MTVKVYVCGPAGGMKGLDVIFAGTQLRRDHEGRSEGGQYLPYLRCCHVTNPRQEGGTGRKVHIWSNGIRRRNTCEGGPAVPPPCTCPPSVAPAPPGRIRASTAPSPPRRWTKVDRAFLKGRRGTRHAGAPAPRARGLTTNHGRGEPLGRSNELLTRRANGRRLVHPASPPRPRNWNSPQPTMASCASTPRCPCGPS